MGIEDKAKDYAKSSLYGSPNDVMWAYMQGANDVLTEIELTMSVSEEGWLEKNLKTLIKELRSDDKQHIESIQGQNGF